MKKKPRLYGLLLAALLATTATAQATMMLKFDLQDLTNRADKIFRGTVIGVEQGTIAAGGGELPAVTYRIAVSELFKGTATETKGDESVIVIRMAGSLAHPKADENGNLRFSMFRDVPKLQEGSEYVLFSTAESAVGLSTTVGLGQGAFRVFTADGSDSEYLAVNEFNNAGLGLDAEGPVEYDKFGAQIRALIGQ